MNLLLTLMLTLSMTLMWLNHPLSMGLILILQTLIVSTIIGYMMTSFFFSYIIIIIMLSGALVLFIYMASVASNEKFNSPINLITFTSTFFLLSLSYLYYNNKSLYLNMSNSTETISLIKIFNTTTAYLTIMMIIYLLITMIVVSNIAKVNEGPLRMKM